MPFYGIIHDSPLLTALSRASRSMSRGSSGGGGNSFSFQFKSLQIYDNALRIYLNTPAGDLWKYMEKRGQRAVIGAKQQVGVRTGALKRSIHMKHLGNLTGQYLWIGATQSHALAHHEGTKAHRIAPNPPNKVLRFNSGTRVVFAREVNHPGTKPNRYLSSQLRHFIK